MFRSAEYNREGRETENWISQWLEAYFLELAGIPETDIYPVPKICRLVEERRPSLACSDEI